MQHSATVSKARLYFVLAILVYIAALCKGIQGRIVFCALQCYQSVWHSAKVSKAGSCFLLCKLQRRIYRRMYIAAQCNGIQGRIVYCALQCYQSAWQSAKVSIQGRIVYSILQGWMFPKPSVHCSALVSKARSCFSLCNAIQVYGIVQRYPRQDCL